MLSVSAVGDSARVTEQLGQLLERTGADELIVACAVHDHALRRRSYELLATLSGTAAG